MTTGCISTNSRSQQLEYIISMRMYVIHSNFLISRSIFSYIPRLGRPSYPGSHVSRPRPSTKYQVLSTRCSHPDHPARWFFVYNSMLRSIPTHARTHPVSVSVSVRFATCQKKERKKRQVLTLKAVGMNSKRALGITDV